MPDYAKMADSGKSAETELEYQHMRRMAFLAVLVSTVAVVAAVVTLPMVYTYVQSLQTHMMAELDFCKVNHRPV